MLKLFVLLLASLIATTAMADAPVIWNGTTVKWLPSGLHSAGVCTTDASGVQSIYNTNGILKLSSGALSSAVAGTDYQAPGLDWLKAGNAGTTPGTDFIGTTDAQDFVVKANGAEQMRYQSGGGWYSSQSVIPVDSTSSTQYLTRLFVDPNIATTSANHTAFQADLIYDNANLGYGFGGSLVANNFGLTLNGDGTVQYAAGLSGNLNINNQGTVNFLRGIDFNTNLAANTTINNYTGLSQSFSNTGGTINDAYGFNSNFTLDSAAHNGMTGVNAGFTFNGTDANSQGLNGFNSYMQFNNSAATTNAINAFNGGIDLNNSADVNGINGFSFYGNFRDTSNAHYLNLASVSGSFEDSAVSSGANAINVNMGYNDSSSGGDVNLANLYMNTNGNASLNSITAVQANPELQGSSTITNANIVNVGGQFRGNNTTTNVTGVNINTQLSGNAGVTNFSAMNINPQISGNATLTNGFTAVNLNPVATNTAGVSSAVGLSINMDNVGLSSAAVAAGEKQRALTFSGGLEGGITYHIPSGATYFQQHYIGGSAVVDSGSPIAAFGFGTNLAQSVELHDDWTADFSGLGYVDVGFVGSLAFDSGKTMYSWTGALGGAGNPGGAGTLTNAKMFSAAGILPQGGSLSVTNMYGFEVNPNTFCAIGTNCWGYYEDTAAAENHMSKLAIGTSSHKVANSSTALEIGNKKAFLNGRGTTAEKNALTPLAGMQFFDTDVGELQVYDGSAWVSASGGGGGSVTAVSVATSNGFAGSSSGGSTPALTLSTTVTGMVKGNGTALSAAVSGTDYAPATSGTAILKGNGAGGFSSATANTDYLPATSGSAIQKANGSGGLTAAVANTDYLPATSGSALQKANGSGGLTAATSGTDYAPATSGSSILKGNGAGGFSSAVANTDYLPATSGSALQKANGSGGLTAATSGTDYAPPSSGTAIQKGNGSGGFSAAVSGTDYAPATSGSALLKGNGAGGFSSAVAKTDYWDTTNFTGDSGSGGVKGLVPAPAAGDAAAGKYLKADGTWATVSGGGSSTNADDNMIYVDFGNGHGSTNTTVRRYSQVRRYAGLVTYADSATNGASFTVATGGAGAWFMCAHERRSGAQAKVGITVNGASLTTDIGSISYANGFRSMSFAGTNSETAESCTVDILADGDVVRVQTSGSENGTDSRSSFMMVRLGTATSQVTMSNGNGYNATDTKIRIYSNVSKNAGSAITGSNTAGTLTANSSGLYAVCRGDSKSTNSVEMGLTVNDTAKTTNIFSLSYSQGKRSYINVTTGGRVVSQCFITPLATNDVVRAHDNGDLNSTSVYSYITMVKVDDGLSTDHIFLDTYSANASVATKKPYFSTVETQIGTSAGYDNSSSFGTSFTIGKAGIYAACMSAYSDGGSSDMGLIEGQDVFYTSNISTPLGYDRGARNIHAAGASSAGEQVCVARYYSAGESISSHTDGSTLKQGADAVSFFLTRVK